VKGEIGDDDPVLDVVLAAIDGVGYAKHEPRSRRLFTWKVGTREVQVTSSRDGRFLDCWPVGETGTVPDAADVMAAVHDRLAAGH
jgi:hypothetical protein